MADNYARMVYKIGSVYSVAAPQHLCLSTEGNTGIISDNLMPIKKFLFPQQLLCLVCDSSSFWGVVGPEVVYGLVYREEVWKAHIFFPRLFIYPSKSETYKMAYVHTY